MKGKTKAPKYAAGRGVDLKADLEKATQENDAAFNEMQKICDQYNAALDDGAHLIAKVTGLINSIANHPKKFDEQIEKIKATQIEQLTIEQYKTKERKAFIEGGGVAAAGAAVGGLYAAMGKGKYRGPIGIIIAIISLLIGGLFTFGKNRKIKEQAIDAINKLNADTYLLKQNYVKVSTALQQIQSTATNLIALLAECEQYRGKDKLSAFPMAEDRKKLSQLVTNTASFAKLLSQKV